MMASNNKKCHIIGAGLGSMDYLTIKGARLLESADVIIYDDLGTKEILQLAKADAKKIYVGKRGGEDCITQDKINEILVEACQQGINVVRLKGGCPSVFSRLNSELAVLRGAGIQVEIVPGVSTALAAPLLAGFPLTDAFEGRNFVVVSGHSASSINWDVVRHADSVVILMAAKRINYIMQQLQQQCQWKNTCPVAIVQNAGCETQKIWRSNIGCIAEEVLGVELSPCIVIVGQVAKQYCDI